LLAGWSAIRSRCFDAITSPQKPADASAIPTGSLAPLELPDAAIRKYLERFAVGAVYIVSGPAGYPCVIGSGTDLADELKAIRSTWPSKIDPPLLAWAAWAFDLRTAQQVASLAVASDLRLAQGRVAVRNHRERSLAGDHRCGWAFANSD
jgi:hypothetical protein